MVTSQCAMASQVTSLTIVYSTVYSGADQRKHQSSASLAFVRGIHRWPVNSPQKGPVARKYFQLMTSSCSALIYRHRGMNPTGTECITTRQNTMKWCGYFRTLCTCIPFRALLIWRSTLDKLPLDSMLSSIWAHFSTAIISLSVLKACDHFLLNIQWPIWAMCIGH